jgi:poly-beta-1,6-N-acetyl-D-glucosamine N-deacetylase
VYSESTKRIAFEVLRWTGIPFLWREIVVRDRTTILAYHQISPVALDRHLSILRRHYRFISLRQFLDLSAEGDGSLPRKSLVITIDDGWLSNCDLLPVFRKHGVRPTIFLTSGIIGTRRSFWWTIPTDVSHAEHLKHIPDGDRVAALEILGHTDTAEYAGRSALSRSEIEEMRKDVDFQAHSVFHPILSQCSDERSRSEIVECKRQLEEEFGLDIYAFAYPNGHLDDFLDRDVRFVREAGYSCALTMDPGSAAADSDMFRLPRHAIDEEVSTSEIVVRASGLPARLKGFFRTEDPAHRTQRVPTHRTSP